MELYLFICCAYIIASICNSGICGNTKTLLSKAINLWCAWCHFFKRNTYHHCKYWIKFNKNKKSTPDTLTHTHAAVDKFSVQTFLPRHNYSTRFVFLKPTHKHSSTFRIHTERDKVNDEK